MFRRNIYQYVTYYKTSCYPYILPSGYCIILTFKGYRITATLLRLGHIRDPITLTNTETKIVFQTFHFLQCYKFSIFWSNYYSYIPFFYKICHGMSHKHKIRLSTMYSQFTILKKIKYFIFPISFASN